MVGRLRKADMNATVDALLRAGTVYIGASVTSFYAWIIMATNGLGPDVLTSSTETSSSGSSFTGNGV